MVKYICFFVAILMVGPAFAQDEGPSHHVMVAGFSNKTGDAGMNWVEHGLRVDLTRRLMRVKNLVVMDTPAFNRIRNELGLVNKDMSKPGAASELGKELGMKTVVIGSYKNAPTGIAVTARLLNTETGEVSEKEFSSAGPPASVTAALAFDIATALGAKTSNAGEIRKSLTSSTDAFQNYCMGLVYKESEETYEKAIEHFIKASEDDKGFAAPHFELGWLFTMTGTGMYRSAVKEYKKAIALYPEYAEAYNNLGLIHSRLDGPQSARSAYLKAIEIVPNYVDAHFNLGRLYDSLDQYDKAIEEYRNAVKLNPADAIAHNNLAVALLNKGDNEKARNSYSAALKLKPDLKEAHLGLGLIYDSEGKLDMAVRHYQKFIDLGGYDEDISQRLEQLKKKDK